MRIKYTNVDGFGCYRELIADRSGFQRAFRRALLREGGLKGRALDIGCGGDIPQPLEAVAERCGRLDGVDPAPEVLRHPRLHRRWHGPFEESEIPHAAYDLAYAYNVVEHIPRGRPFFRKVRDILKPGGVFWALTPHARHPFALLARAIEVAGLKQLSRSRSRSSESGEYTVNNYPAYYRLNSRSQVARAVTGLGFASLTIHYYPCMQWDTYFPRCLRWAPHLYDYLLGVRVRPLMQILAYRLQVKG